MNRAQIANSIMPDLRRWHLANSLAPSLMFVAVVACIVFLAATFTLLTSDGISFGDYVASVAFLGVFGSLAFKFVMDSEHYSKIAKAAWMDLYGETTWLTPGGEAGRVKSVNETASRLELAFAVGEARWFAFQDLSPTSEGVVADFSGLDDTRMPKIDFFDGSRNLYITASVMACVVTLTLAYAAWYLDSIVFWQAYLVAVMLVVSFSLPYGLFQDGEFRASSISEHTAHIAQTTWKALDGKIGVVRWATRAYAGNSLYEEHIVLAFPDGKVRQYRREDLMPMTFETPFAV